MRNKIHVVHAKPGEAAVVLDIDPTVESLRRLVGGSMAATSSPWAGLIVYVNDTGRLDGLPFNQAVGVNQIYGAFVVTKADSEGDAADLSPVDAARVVADLHRWRAIDEIAETLDAKADGVKGGASAAFREAAQIVRAKR